MRASFVKVDPSGNATAFILDPFPREIHAKIAAEIMKPTSLGVDQVGFIEQASVPGALARLQMMGGEFCGNAARGFAAYLAARKFPGIHLIHSSDRFSVPIEVSGHDGVLEALVGPTSEGTADVEISMPIPLSIEHKSLAGGGELTLIHFEGITHCVLWDVPPAEEKFCRVREELSSELRNIDCIGAMFYDQSTNRLTPLVYVRKVNSLVWEGSCGSGTVAVAAALADKRKQSIRSLCLSQPGGDIEVDVLWDQKIVEAKIRGNVSIKAEGTVYFSI